MSTYKRLYQSHSMYFFTVVTHDRYNLFSNANEIAKYYSALHKVKLRYPFRLIAQVILPDHLHAIWHLPHHDHDFSIRWRLIRCYFSLTISAPHNHRKEKAVWQRQFWEHLIRDENDFIYHMDYIHYNPVKHGYVDTPQQWAHSSFHHWVKKGLYEQDWGSSRTIAISKLDGPE